MANIERVGDLIIGSAFNPAILPYRFERTRFCPCAFQANCRALVHAELAVLLKLVQASQRLLVQPRQDYLLARNEGL